MKKENDRKLVSVNKYLEKHFENLHGDRLNIE